MLSLETVLYYLEDKHYCVHGESTLGKYIRAENEQKHLMTRNPDLSARARHAVGEGDSPQ